MNHRVFRDFFPDDDPPAPQEPPQHHTPLSPPRSRAIYNRSPWSLSGLGKANSRNSLPAQPSLSRLQNPKTRTRSADETQRTSTCLAASINIRVTKDKIGLMTSNTSPVDQRPSKTPEAQPRIVPPATISAPAGADLGPHVSKPKNEPKSTLPTCGAERKRPPIPGISSSHKTTTMQPLLEGRSAIPGHPYANTAQAPAGETYFAMRRDSIDADGRSLISTLLDAYCRSEADDEELEFMRKDDASLLFSDDTMSLEYASIPDRSRSPGPPAPTPSAVSQLDDPPKHPKPASLIIASLPNWEAASLKLGFPSSPETGSSMRNSRPLPPVPPNQRQSRPLPSPPAPPPYTSPVDSTPLTPPLSTSSQSSDSSASATSSPSGGSTLITSVSTSPSTSSAQIKLDKLSSHPKISKRPLLAPIVTFPGSSLGLPSPLTPDIPLPPSPNTAKLHQATKLSKMLGEDITPDLLCGRQACIRSPNQASKLSKMLGEDITPDLLYGRQAPLRHPNRVSKSNNKDTSPDFSRREQASTRPLNQVSKLSNMLGEDITPELLYGRQVPIRPVLPSTRSDSLTRHVARKASKDRVDPIPSSRPTFTPSPTPQDAGPSSPKLRSRAVRPQAIYLDYDTVEDAHKKDVSAVAEDAGSVSKVSASGRSARRSESRVEPTGSEKLDDQKSLSSASGLTVASDTTSLSELEELDDFEEAHIGWALQNVVTYQKASRIKRTSRMWVLEKDGQRWEQYNHANVTTVLGQL